MTSAVPGARPHVQWRTWGLLLVALGVAAGLCFVGAWQWRVGVHQDSATLPRDPSVPVDSLLPPGKPLPRVALARTVTARGTYDGSAALLVTGQEQGGTSGSWQLVPLRTSDGAVLAVVRGFVPSGGVSPAVPTGTVTVTGRVQAPFVAPPVTGVDPAPTVSSVDTADLVNRWGGPIHPGYVVAEQERPRPPTSVLRVPAQAPGAGTSVSLRNLAYAIQWFAFAGFVLVVWWRQALDDVRSARRAVAAPAAPAGTSAAPPQPPPPEFRSATE